MFYVREKPWHGLGVRVEEAPSSAEALEVAGLNWRVLQEPIFSDTGGSIPGYKANIRESDRKVLGVVTNKYKVIQNYEAFAFTDSLLGEGVTYETAGSLQGGRKVWLLAKMPEAYQIFGEEISTYLVFSNTHDGSGAVKVALTPIRVVCNNTLNLALSNASRSWAMIHKGDIKARVQEAHATLFRTNEYMQSFSEECNSLQRIKMSDDMVNKCIHQILPIEENAGAKQIKNVLKLRNELMFRYAEAPDLKDMDKTAYRFINAVSDFATHAKPLRQTRTYNENLFMRTVDGNTMIDKAYKLVTAA